MSLYRLNLANTTCVFLISMTIHLLPALVYSRKMPFRCLRSVQLHNKKLFYHTTYIYYIHSTIRSSFQRISPSYSTPTVSYSPPPTPRGNLLSSTPVARPLRPPPSFRLAEASIPPCCRCCCKKETVSFLFQFVTIIFNTIFHIIYKQFPATSMFQAAEMKKDANWTPPSPKILNLPKAEYFLVSKASLLELLTGCNSCTSGKNDLSFSEDAHALTCARKCTSCGEASKWSNSPVLETSNASSWEKLRKVNVDMVTGSACTAVGTAVRSRSNSIILLKN